MRLEIIKQINLTGLGLKKVGDYLDIEDAQGNILVRMGFGKESKVSKEEAEVIAEIEAEEAEKPKRTRRTKEQIELDKKK